jgi:hypothetical protein
MVVHYTPTVYYDDLEKELCKEFELTPEELNLSEMFFTCAEPSGFNYIRWDENTKQIIREEIEWNNDWRRNSFYTFKISILEYLEENYSQYGVELLVICNY